MKQIIYCLLFVIGFILALSESKMFISNIIGITVLAYSAYKLNRLFTFKE